MLPLSDKCPGISFLLGPALDWTPVFLGRQLSREQWESLGLSVVPTPGNTGSRLPALSFTFFPRWWRCCPGRCEAGQILNALLTTLSSHTCACARLYSCTQPWAHSLTYLHAHNVSYTLVHTHPLTHPGAHMGSRGHVLAHAHTHTLAWWAHSLTLTLAHMCAHTHTHTHVLQEALSLSLWPQHLVI